MVFTRDCQRCGKPWNFHDDEPVDEFTPLYCDECMERWNMHVLIQEIAQGKITIHVPGLNDDEFPEARSSPLD